MPHSNVLSTNRIESLVDGIFAIAMTLLAFDLRVPQVAADALQNGITMKIMELWPHVLVYVMSFVILGFYWIGHHIQYNYVRYTDRPFLWINLFFLMFIALVPFSTSLLAQYEQERIVIILYGLNVLLIGIFSSLHWWYATVHHRLVDHDISPALVTTITRRTLVSPTTALLAMMLSFVDVKISLFLYAATPIYYMVRGRIDRYWTQPALAHTHSKSTQRRSKKRR